MERIKKISAALIAFTMACGIMASCGDSTDSKDDTKETTTAATEAAEKEEDADADADAEGDAEADADADAEGGDEAADDGALADISPDTEYKHKYEFDGYDAFLMFADNPNWFWSNFNGEGHVHAEDFDESDSQNYGYGVDADITGDGEYTVSLTKDSIYSSGNGYINAQALLDEDNGTIFPAEGISVFCIDIIGICNGDYVSGLADDGTTWEMAKESKKNELKADLDNHYNVDAVGDYSPADLTVHVTSIKCDGEEIEFDESKIRYGNIEDNNNRYRIEIYNSYGTTGSDSPFYDENIPFTFTFNKTLEVTFTIEGLGEVKTFPEVEPFAAE